MPDHSSTTADLPVVRRIRGLARALPPVHPDGRKFIATPLSVALVGWRKPGILVASLAAAGAAAWAFRDTERVAPDLAGVVLSPADGLMETVDEAVPPAGLGLGSDPLPTVSIRASLLDPAVQRAPVSGEVTAVDYAPPGEFEFRGGATPEHNGLVITTGDGHQIGVVQVGGSVVKRIVCQVDEGDEVTAGQTYGLVRFGSRVDVILPAGATPLVKQGQRAVAGETVLALG